MLSKRCVSTTHHGVLIYTPPKHTLSCAILRTKGVLGEQNTSFSNKFDMFNHLSEIFARFLLYQRLKNRITISIEKVK